MPGLATESASGRRNYRETGEPSHRRKKVFERRTRISRATKRPIVTENKKRKRAASLRSNSGQVRTDGSYRETKMAISKEERLPGAGQT